MVISAYIQSNCRFKYLYPNANLKNQNVQIKLYLGQKKLIVIYFQGTWKNNAAWELVKIILHCFF